jgi:uncharacterized membrane protein
MKKIVWVPVEVDETDEDSAWFQLIFLIVGIPLAVLWIYLEEEYKIPISTYLGIFFGFVFSMKMVYILVSIFISIAVGNFVYWILGGK